MLVLMIFVPKYNTAFAKASNIDEENFANVVLFAHFTGDKAQEEAEYFENLVKNENVHMKNTIVKSSNTRYPDSWYDSCNGEGDKNYYCASEDIVNYYLDPRNFLNESSCRGKIEFLSLFSLYILVHLYIQIL